MENQLDLTLLIFSFQMQTVPCILTQVEFGLDRGTVPALHLVPIYSANMREAEKG